MKLTDYAKKNGIRYLTAYTYWKKGYLKGKQLPTGTILVEEEELKEPNISRNILENSAILYARVSSAEGKNNLKTQLDRLREYSIAKGYKIVKEVTEIGSGVNDKRRKLLSIIKNKNCNIIVVEHKDRFCRFGTAIIEELLKQTNKRLEVINQVDIGQEDIIQDLISIITSYSAKIYGLRRSTRKTEKIIKKLKKEKLKYKYAEDTKKTETKE